MAQVAVLAQVDIDPAHKEAFDARARRHSAIPRPTRKAA